MEGLPVPPLLYRMIRLVARGVPLGKAVARVAGEAAGQTAEVPPLVASLLAQGLFVLRS